MNEDKNIKGMEMKKTLITGIVLSSIFAAADNFVVIVNSENIEIGSSIVGERSDPWSDWNTDREYDCTTWIPSVSSIDWGVDFTQTQNCKQDQSRTRDVYDVWTDGTETLNRIESETQIINVENEKEETGTKKIREMCINILNRGLSTGNGVYNVDPDGDGSTYSPVSAYCDMDNGGWTLYDSFGTKLLQTGQANPNSYNGKSINTRSAISSAGYNFYSGTLNSNGGYDYYFDDYHIQWYQSGSPVGYLEKTMPVWAEAIKVRSSNQWYGGTQRIIYGSDTRTVAGNTPEKSYIFNDTGGKLLRMEENGIFWTESVWVK